MTEIVTRITKEINISDIQMDRYPLNPSTLSLVKYLERGGEVPPIKVAKKMGGGYLIRDGRHRITANKLLGKATIMARFSTQPLKERRKDG